MRRSIVFAACAASVALAAGLVACIDLFHATDDIRTACQLDGDTPGCDGAHVAPEAAVEAGTDFCGPAWTDAGAHAQHACAWLGACETPLGRNAYGECMFQALLAYDCAANPSHPVRGQRHDIWDCLWQAKSCADVDACMFPLGKQACAGGSETVCATKDDKATGRSNLDVRLECNGDAGSGAENCALWGQACADVLNSVPGVCAGARGSSGLHCSSPNQECSGTSIHWCPSQDAGDIGIDCDGVGARACIPEPSADAATWLACLPDPNAGTQCTPDASAQCSSGVAISCASGTLERIDCKSLLGNDPRACNAGPLNPTFDFTSPCYVDAGAPPDASPDAASDAGADGSPAGATCVDTCTDAGGGTITGCTRGVSFTLRCSDVNLPGPCALHKTETFQRAACDHP
jgi:hypothetical protein